MIKDIKIDNFISHKNTFLTFNNGVTLFVGHNGSGKSSVIDAVTFALFGEHTRKSNKNIIRRGSGMSYVQLNFSVGSREYSAYRQLAASGQSLSAKFELVSEAGNAIHRPIIFGERKQFGESMSAEVAKVLGMDYKKLKVAAIVQQGELSKIIESQPKEFKELLNSLIGIDRLDLAYQTMREVIDGFRERLRDNNGGFDDKQIESIKRAVEQKMVSLYDAEHSIIQLVNLRNSIVTNLAYLEKEIERMEPLILQSRELQTIEDSLVKYVNEGRDCIANEIRRIERTSKEARNSIKAISEKEEVEINLQMVRSEIEDIEKRVVDNEGDSGRLKGLAECASKLDIKDGKCPVCNSSVISINDMFEMDHILTEIKLKATERAKLLVDKINLKKEEVLLEEKEKKIAIAEKFMVSNCIENIEQITKLEQEILRKKSDLSKLPNAKIERVEIDPMQLGIDEFSKSLAEKIIKLREQIRDLHIQEYTDSKLKRTRLSNELVEINTKISVTQRTIQETRETIETSNKILTELGHASKYLVILESIRSVVFNRDGIVGLSLRSWSLKMISMKASDYVAMFNIGISRIDVTEKARDIGVTCYGRNGEIDMDSLSGGERVAVALALRLAIAYMMGTNKLDFIILDEPTTHLDEERRKSLVKIIAEVFRDGVGPLSQVLIITHDAEIFENSDVDRVYRFTMSTDGSCVLAE